MRGVAASVNGARRSCSVVTTDDDEFVESVQRDLDALPTIEEPRSKRP